MVFVSLKSWHQSALLLLNLFQLFLPRPEFFQQQLNVYGIITVRISIEIQKTK